MEMPSVVPDFLTERTKLMKYTISLPIRVKAGAMESTIHPVVIRDEKNLILVDCGFPNLLPNIEDAILQTGAQMHMLTKIIITHHDHDHMGSLKAFTEKYPGVEIYCSKEQAPYVTGKKKSLRLIQAEMRHKTLQTEVEKLANQKFMDVILSVEYVDLVITVKDGDVFPECGGIEIIDTSGHMPGHLCVYVRQEKTLIAGDALIIENGVLQGPSPRFTLDMPAAIQSLEKLMTYDIERVICYHGGEYSGDVKSSLLKIIEEGK